MNRTDYKNALKFVSTLKPSDSMGFLLTSIEIMLTTVAIFFILSDSWFLFIVGQLLFAFSALRWQILFHDLVHYSLFKSKILNVVVGHFAALFCLMPFYNYRLIHNGHHRWVGWIDKDPDLDGALPEKIHGWRLQVVNFCWKCWIPIFSLAYPFGYWNPEKLKPLIRSKREKIHVMLSSSSMIVAYILLFYFVGSATILLFLPAILLNLFACDPILISHHLHLPHKRANGAEVKSNPYFEQDQYARHTIFPRWFAVYAFYNFNAHVDHHLFPNVPCYHLQKIDVERKNSIHWFQWIKLAKSMTAAQLLFGET